MRHEVVDKLELANHNDGVRCLCFMRDKVSSCSKLLSDYGDQVAFVSANVHWIVYSEQETSSYNGSLLHFRNKT